MDEDILVVTLRDFKTNMAKYINALRRGQYRYVVLRRYRKRIAVVSVPDLLKSSEKVNPQNPH